ncbi:MAG: chemotaxis protein CheB [Agriterribacter sp.]
MAKEEIKNIRLIVIGGSSGSLKVILHLLRELRTDFTIPMLLVLHRNNQQESVLAELLAAKSFLPVKEVDEKDALLAGHIYIAPQDYHVLLESDGYFSLDYSEKMHYSRPSIDVSFISAAEAYGSNLVCILLSGANADGAEGLQEVKKHNGIAIVQDPDEAEVDYMPRQALQRGEVDYLMNTNQLVDFLNGL